MLILSANYRGYDAPYRMPGAVVYDERRHDNTRLTGRYLGRAPKCAPHLLGHNEDDILWIDGSMRWTGRDLDELFALVPRGGMGLFRHRWRNCIYEEAEASIPLTNRYTGEPIKQQAEHYRKEGHPANWGLWEVTMIVWRGAQKDIGGHWLAEQLVWTDQDQISLPVILLRHGVRVADLRPGNVMRNPWFLQEPHARGEWLETSTTPEAERVSSTPAAVATLHPPRPMTHAAMADMRRRQRIRGR